MTTLSMPAPTALSSRDRAILRAVARGVAEFVLGAEPVLYLDGLACSDQFAVCQLVRDGLVDAVRPAALGRRVAARLTSAGAAHVATDPVRQRALLADLLPPPGTTGGATAVDLGCGSGAQALALADLGYGSVLAVDTDATLLTEPAANAAARPAVRAWQADARCASQRPGGQFASTS